MHAALPPIICAFGDSLTHRLRRSRSTLASTTGAAIIENGKITKPKSKNTRWSGNARVD